MAAYALPFLAVLFLWWFSTGAILYLDGLPRRSYRWSLAGATLLALGALVGTVLLRDATAIWAAYAGFLCGLVLWGWHEITFLTGCVTGARRQGCAKTCRGWRHAWHAFQAIAHHELALLATVLLLGALSWQAENQLAFWTFFVLWLMRISTKINVFLGVPNITESFLPEHLRYLTSFFTHKPMNLAFPLSVTFATVAGVLLAVQMFGSSPGSFAATRDVMLLTLLGLGLAEHWFLVLPLPVERLWRWGLASHDQRAKAEARVVPSE
jgi:putative photosynthetic complex assembly protein 2